MKPMHKVLLTIAIAMVIYMIVRSLKSAVPAEVKKENYVDSRCLNVDTTKLLKVYHMDISALSKDIVDAGIDIDMVDNSKNYPIVATKLLQSGKVICNRFGELERKVR